jgi:hypothetical protein
VDVQQQEPWHVVAMPAPVPPPVPRARTTPRRLAVVATVSLAGSLALGGVVRAMLPEPASRDLAQGTVTEVPGGSYSFTSVHDDGSPVRWNPCEPIRYVTNLASAPPGALDDLAVALTQLSSATGIEFVSEGGTDERASSARDAYQPERYGRRWAPVLIAWDDLAATGLQHTAETVGVSTPIAVSRVGRPATYVSGQVVIATGHELAPGFGTGDARGAVLMHELAHTVGLGHTPDELQIMYDGRRPRPGAAQWGSGDQVGLRLLGRGAGCLRTPPPSRVG